MTLRKGRRLQRLLSTSFVQRRETEHPTQALEKVGWLVSLPSTQINAKVQQRNADKTYYVRKRGEFMYKFRLFQYEPYLFMELD